MKFITEISDENVQSKPKGPSEHLPLLLHQAQLAKKAHKTYEGHRNQDEANRTQSFQH